MELAGDIGYAPPAIGGPRLVASEFGGNSVPEGRSDRLVVDVGIEVPSTGASYLAWAYDFSGDGCAVELLQALPGEGRQVTLVFDASHRIAGRLLWRAHRNGFVQFNDPASDAVVQHLVDRAHASERGLGQASPDPRQPKARERTRRPVTHR